MTGRVVLVTHLYQETVTVLAGAHSSLTVVLTDVIQLTVEVRVHCDIDSSDVNGDMDSGNALW